jgi:predicted GNAT family acetyltransferase
MNTLIDNGDLQVGSHNLTRSEHPLDNPIWNALSTRQIAMSLGDHKARRYKPIYTTLAGVAAQSPEDFASLANVVSSADRVGLCTPEALMIPDGWHSLSVFAVAQMVCDELIESKYQDVVVLKDREIPEMIALATLTQPGPFAERTIDFGTFYGIHNSTESGGKLVAMAGERMKIYGGYDEVSAVCTHPDYQGKGMAKALVQKVTKNIFERGHTPILHVRSDNAGAIRSYQALGFKERKQMIFTILQPD